MAEAYLDLYQRVLESAAAEGAKETLAPAQGEQLGA
jgi:hypothetical protein